MSSDPEQEYFAEGMVDDLTTAISRFHYLFVIARIRRLPTVDVREIGRQ
jgi:adenylate cyclase